MILISSGFVTVNVIIDQVKIDVVYDVGACGIGMATHLAPTFSNADSELFNGFATLLSCSARKFQLQFWLNLFGTWKTR